MPASRRPRHVWLDGRRFVVSFDEEGRPKVISERKNRHPGTPQEALYDTPYWNRAHKRPKDPDSMVTRILDRLKEMTT